MIILIERTHTNKSRKKRHRKNMSGTELIKGMEEVVQHIRELEAERDNYKRKWENVKNVSAGRQRKIDKLKEEQLTEENAIQYVYENTDEYDDWVKGSTAYKELQEENKKLKEENKKPLDDYQKVLDYMTGHNDCDVFDVHSDWIIEEIKKLKKENKKLKEENNKLEENLIYYRFYAYTLDRSGDCDLTKEDVDYFTDAEIPRKILYERIGYEENSDEEDNDPEEYGEYTWKQGLTAEEIAKGDTIDAETGEALKKEEGVITDLNGKKMKVPSEEVCLQMFGVSQGEFIALAKQSDCSQL